MLNNITELIEQLKTTNSGKSLAIKTTNTSLKNNENITELSIKQLLLDNGLQEQKKIKLTKNELIQEYTKQTGKTYYKLSSKDGKHLSETDKADQINKFTAIKETYKTPLKNGYFMWQPNGSQKAPDFVVNLNGILNIESKAGKSVMFNSGLPKSDTFYMCEFSDGTVHRDFGSNIFSEPNICEIMGKVREEFEEHNQDAINRIKKCGKFSNEQLAIIEKYNLPLYARAMMSSFSSNDIIWNIK